MNTMAELRTRVLLIEDDEEDVVVLRQHIAGFRLLDYDLHWERDYAGGLHAAKSGAHDVCLLDDRVGGRNGVELLTELRLGGSVLPVIFLTARSDSAIDLAAITAGATDYLIKSETTAPLLERSIRYAIERSRIERLRADSERRRTEEALGFQAHLLDAVQQAVVATDLKGTITYWNPYAERLYGWRAEEAIGRYLLDVTPTQVSSDQCAELMARLNAGESWRGEFQIQRRDGTTFTAHVTDSPLHDREGRLVGIVGIFENISDRKRAEEDRLALSKHVGLLMESTTQWLFGMDADGRFTFANGAGAAALGYTPSEMIGRDAHSLIHHSDEDGAPRTAENCLIRQALVRGESVRVEHDVLWRRDGTPLPVSFAASPVREDGRIAGVVVAFTDETARRAAERALHEREEHLATLVSIQQEVATARLDLDYIIQLAAARAQELTGADGAAVELVDGDEIEFRATTGTAVVLHGLRLRIDSSISGACVRTASTIRSDNADHDRRVDLRASQSSTLRSCIVTPLLHEGVALGVLKVIASRPAAFDEGHERTIRLLGGLLGSAMGRARDLHANEALAAERAAAIETLSEREAHFRSLIENASNPIILLDAAGLVTYVSPGSPRVLGYDDLREVYNRHVSDFLHPDERELATTLLEQVMNTPGNAITAELRIRHADGRYLTMTCTCCNLLHDSAVHAVVVNLRDITEQKRLESQLRQAQKMEAIGLLAGGIAHDFNNILTAITINTEFLLSDLGAADPRRAEATEIRKSAERAASLTRQLLAFSRRQVMQPRDVNLNSVVKDLTPMLQRLIGEDIAVQVEVDPDLPIVFADPGQLEQVLVNLAVNARDAMPNGGALSIGTRRTMLDGGYATNHPGARAGEYATLVVGDNGCGMSPEVQARIFEPFFTTKAPGAGTGLGLATVYGIVKQSDGYIACESNEGVGTTFFVHLPAQGTAAAPRPATTPSSPARESGTVLLVEDEDAVRVLATRVLRRRGYTVHAAKDGEEAWRLLQGVDTPVDLVITDLVMPVMGGQELAERLRTLPKPPRVLFTTGYTDDALIRRGSFPSGVAYLEKPFSMEALAAAVRNALARHDPAHEVASSRSSASVS